MQGDENLSDFQPDDRKIGTDQIAASVVPQDAAQGGAEVAEEYLIGDPLNEGGSEVCAEGTSIDDKICAVCRQPLSKIFLNVDGNTLIMESCDGCDIRRWQLAGKRIDLKRALEEVEEHVSRARN